MSNGIASLTTRDLFKQLGPVDISPLPDEIESEFNPQTFTRILFKGLLKGDSVDEITEKAFKKLPKSLETAENRQLVRELVIQSLQQILPKVDATATGEFLKTNPEFNFGFDEAVEFVLDREGGYSNHASDRGGETKYGISKKAYPDLDIKELKVDDAKAIYERDYWKRAGCDKLAWPMNLIVFDTAVNCGVGRARQWLKQAESPADYLKMREDFYHATVKSDPSQKVNLQGWLNRLDELRNQCGLI